MDKRDQQKRDLEIQRQKIIEQKVAILYAIILCSKEGLGISCKCVLLVLS